MEFGQSSVDLLFGFQAKLLRKMEFFLTVLLLVKFGQIDCAQCLGLLGAGFHFVVYTRFLQAGDL